jgi:adenine deaminase
MRTAISELQHQLAVSRGDLPADLVFRNGRIVNVLSGEVHGGDVAVTGGIVAGIGQYEGRETVDLKGRYIAPAFIDGHIHIESTMLTPAEFARAVVPRGTCAVVADPHEFANVLGVRGIEYVFEAAEQLPLDVYVMVPSCVPATPLETSGATITADDIVRFIGRADVAGIAEMMNFPGVFLGWESELEKLRTRGGKTVDGHSPGLTGKNLNAYILAGIESDHECTTLEEAREKLRLGMHILIREGTAERNLHELLPLVTPASAPNFSFATDDKHPPDLENEGHIDHHIRESIARGLDPILAFQLGTINTARHYGLEKIGAIAPGFYANLVLFDDLLNPLPDEVYYRGKLVARSGVCMAPSFAGPDTVALVKSMNVRNFEPADLAVRAAGGKKIRVIGIIPRQIVTEEIIETPRVENDLVVSDPDRDVIKLVVIERHHATGNIGIGFVRGFGLKSGAIASTVAHDAHNIIVAGVSDADIHDAAMHLVEIGGGQCVVNDGRVLEDLPLPIAGLVSDRPLAFVRKKTDDLIAAAVGIGCKLRDPFMTLSFLALSPIPALKVTDKGLVDAVRFELTDIFV